MDREIAEVGGTYTLAERNELPGNFASENDALMLNNSILGEKNIEITETWRGPSRSSVPEGFLRWRAGAAASRSRFCLQCSRLKAENSLSGQNPIGLHGRAHGSCD